MARQKQSNDWGFPRWRSYEKGREAARIRLCDREGCNKVGDRPAPKAPNRPERWYFCEPTPPNITRAGTISQACRPKRRRAARPTRSRAPRPSASRRSGNGPVPATAAAAATKCARSMRSSLDSDAEFAEVKAAYRKLAKENHPDLKPGDEEADVRFKQVQAAYDVLKKAEERRLALGESLIRKPRPQRSAPRSALTSAIMLGTPWVRLALRCLASSNGARHCGDVELRDLGRGLVLDRGQDQRDDRPW